VKKQEFTMKYPQHLLKLIDVLKKFPGVGTKSAERFAFEMMSWSSSKIEEMAHIIQQSPLKLTHCRDCGCLTDSQSCSFCHSSATRLPVLCLVGMPRDVFAIESTHEFKGFYHVLGALLSPMHGIGPDKLNIQTLRQRIVDLNIQELIIALDSTLEGDATTLYLKQELGSLNLSISRLAFGLPMGSSLDYVDGGTLAHALASRTLLKRSRCHG
jgi:recombination protein RecR